MEKAELSLSSQIESLLFWKGDSMTVNKLSTLLKKDEEEIKKSLRELKEKLGGRGITLVELNDEVSLQTVPEMSELIESLQKEELSRDLGKAALETLSIVVYRAPVSRKDIDYIRGVNSTFILRNLLIRGLVEKMENATDARSFLYKPTLDLVSYLGLSSLEELPDYSSTRAELLKVSEPSKKPEAEEEVHAMEE
jgi:segregation and condensation protein B